MNLLERIDLRESKFFVLANRGPTKHLVFLVKMHRKSPQLVNYYGDSKLLRHSILVRRGPLGREPPNPQPTTPQSAEFKKMPTRNPFLRGRELKSADRRRGQRKVKKNQKSGTKKEHKPNPEGPKIEKNQSRLKFSILDLQNSPTKIGVWWAASLENFNLD